MLFWVALCYPYPLCPSVVSSIPDIEPKPFSFHRCRLCVAILRVPGFLRRNRFVCPNVNLLIPKISLRIRSEDIVTSSIPMGSLSSYVPSFAVKEYHFPSIYREKLCSFFGLYICTPFSSTMKFSFSFSRNS